MPKHYIVGAGMVGCLYDWGPEAYATESGALEAAQWYLEALDDVAPEDLQTRALEALACDGIYYFSAEERPLVGADYIEISEVEGECPEQDD